MSKHLKRSSVLLALLGLFVAGDAFAQTSTTGALRGNVTDGKAPLPGATVIVTSSALQGSQGEITDADGNYFINNLPPGTYTITVSMADTTVKRSNVIVRVGKVSLMDVPVVAQQAGEVIEIKGRAPLLDLGTTKTGVTLNQDYTRNVPTGRTFEDQLEVATGTQNDEFGVSFSGATSPENSYVVDGVHITDPLFGTLNGNLPPDFVNELEVITGAYGAEFGRSTGGIVNAVTKSGSNEFHGSVYGYFTPGALVGETRNLQSAGSSISHQNELDFAADFGAEVGGPIIKDKLWFHAGFNPSLENITNSRVISTLTDNDNDGVPDVDPDTGFAIRDEVARNNVGLKNRRYFYTGKLSYAYAPEHQGHINVFGNPGGDQIVDDEFAVGPNQTNAFNRDAGIIAVGGRWTSTFNDNASRIEANVGYFQGSVTKEPRFVDDANLPSVRYVFERDFSDFAAIDDVPAECMDGSGSDAFPMIQNCPVQNYQFGNVDLLQKQDSSRISGGLAYTQRARLAGHHIFKGGLDIESNRTEFFNQFPGGRFWHFGPFWAAWSILSPDDAGAIPCGVDLDGDGAPDSNCAEQVNGLNAKVDALNVAAYVQDSWQVLDNLTVNAGLRWERQALSSGQGVDGATFNNRPVEGRPLVLDTLFSPRVGAVYDWTNEGKSRVFANWGRYYEQLPLDLAARGLGGEILNVDLVAADNCSDTTDATQFSCTFDPNNPAEFFGAIQLGDGVKIVAPDIQGQRVDEFVGGVEYEPLDDLAVGVTYFRRDLGEVIEDISTDGGNSRIIANPGRVDEGAVRNLREQAAAAEAGGDMLAAAQLNREANLIEGAGLFDRPKRVYNALELHANKRFSNGFFVRAAYRFSKTEGNYPGLFSPTTNQLDPNFTTMYDLPELMANRYGDLPHDRPHSIKIDGYYTMPVEGIGRFTLGGRFRGISGRPHNHLGLSLLGGGAPNEVFILPRASGDRGPFQSATDLHIGYGRLIDKERGIGLEAFVDVFNVFNQRPTTRRDESYTFDPVNPIVGGSEEQLQHLKALDGAGGNSAGLASVNPNFGNATAAQAPIAARFGLRLTF